MADNQFVALQEPSIPAKKKLNKHRNRRKHGFATIPSSPPEIESVHTNEPSVSTPGVEALFHDTQAMDDTSHEFIPVVSKKEKKEKKERTRAARMNLNDSSSSRDEAENMDEPVGAVNEGDDALESDNDALPSDDSEDADSDGDDLSPIELIPTPAVDAILAQEAARKASVSSSVKSSVTSDLYINAEPSSLSKISVVAEILPSDAVEPLAQDDEAIETSAQDEEAVETSAQNDEAVEPVLATKGKKKNKHNNRKKRRDSGTASLGGAKVSGAHGEGEVPNPEMDAGEHAPEQTYLGSLLTKVKERCKQTAMVKLIKDSSWAEPVLVFVMGFVAFPTALYLIKKGQASGELEG
ncbi:hypothetical protein EJ04DRAFT_528658 [Polyplosphaeria fusca]|uniref:Uncharacterized protein n=1 Tax=Polyplosphaeria fusca TaxID=682080 RepID=A0A9P4QLB3_9PLEO|nr:hypothetical protein EJ04DRAFT_528658 [Polyplosphaeria fusca]